MIGEETLKYIMGVLIGLPWPEGDPEVCRQAATFWRKVAKAVESAETDMRRSKTVIAGSGNTGASIREFHVLVDDVLPRLGRVREATTQLADTLDGYADELGKAQHRFTYLATRVATDIGVTVLFGFLTVGLGSAVTAVYLIRVFGLGVTALAELSMAARALIMATYYVVDSLAYMAIDVLALKGVDMAFGEAGQNWGDALTQTFVANVGFDMAFDAQNAAAHKVLGQALASNLWVRAAMRFTSSAFVYAPIEYAMDGNPLTPSGLAPTYEQLEQKGIIHVLGRRFLTDPYRSGVDAAVTAWTKRLLGK